MFPYLILLIGLVLVLLEFYLPGAILGSAGGILILASIVFFALANGSALSIFLFMVLAFIGLIGVVKFALWQIPRTKKRQSIYLDSDQAGYKATSFNEKLIGKEGSALTDLKPGGYILIEGKKYPAISVSGYLSKGDLVKVISGQEEHLNVKISNKENDL